MATQKIFTGDTVRARGTFTDLDEELIDADDDLVIFSVYDAETLKKLSEDTCTRQSIGVFYFDYTVPSVERAYFFEMAGDFGGYPQLKRKKVKATFKG